MNITDARKQRKYRNAKKAQHDEKIAVSHLLGRVFLTLLLIEKAKDVHKRGLVALTELVQLYKPANARDVPTENVHVKPQIIKETPPIKEYVDFELLYSSFKKPPLKEESFEETAKAKYVF